MVRSLLVLLLNYLLVVCASVAGRAAPPVAQAYGYVHHPIASLTVAVAAAISCVRRPRPATSCAGFHPANLHPKGAWATLVTPLDQRPQHRADQSRYQAKCRVAMAF